MKDAQWDKLLRIRTSGRDDSRSDQYRYPYEPTPYSVLERLAESGFLTKKNTLLDYGSGKGRVSFFLAYQAGCRCIGVEADDRIYAASLENLETAASSGKTAFEQAEAEKYKVPETVDRCFFFNPFSVEILKKVTARILESWYETPREIILFYYYPSDEYISYLMSVPEMMFTDEIDCRDLFPKTDDRERIMIFSTAVQEKRK